MEIDDLTSIIFLVVFGMLLLLVIVIVIMQLSGKKILKEKLAQEELKVEHKRELLTHAIETQEKERDRLAAEIHDDITSKLNIIHIHLAGLEKETTSETHSKIQSLNKVVETSIVDSRRIAYDLFPVVLEKFGLRTALEELQDLHSNNKINVRLQTDITDSTLNSNSAVHIYRIAQELLNNSLKHSYCSEISLTLNVNQEKGELVYRDNGVGDAKKITNAVGMGFKNINSRLSVLNGDLSVINLSPGIEFNIHFKATVQ